MAPVLTADEVAALLKTSKDTIYRLARLGIIPGVKLGSCWRFNRETIEQLMRRPNPLDGSNNLDAHLETATSVAIITLGYRARCVVAGCRNVGRLILRHVDAAGRLVDNGEFCVAHGRSRLQRDRAAGLKIYDDREAF